MLNIGYWRVTRQIMIRTVCTVSFLSYFEKKRKVCRMTLPQRGVELSTSSSHKFYMHVYIDCCTLTNEVLCQLYLRRAHQKCAIYGNIAVFLVFWASNRFWNKGKRQKHHKILHFLCSERQLSEVNCE